MIFLITLELDGSIEMCQFLSNYSERITKPVLVREGRSKPGWEQGKLIGDTKCKWSICSEWAAHERGHAVCWNNELIWPVSGKRWSLAVISQSFAFLNHNVFNKSWGVTYSEFYPPECVSGDPHSGYMWLWGMYPSCIEINDYGVSNHFADFIVSVSWQKFKLWALLWPPLVWGWRPHP